jgi:FkbM family methyltransferase
MTALRSSACSLLLRVPTSLRSLRHLPVLGELIHRVSHYVLPADQMVWAQVRCGPGQGLWIEVYPRTGQFYITGDAELPTQTLITQRLQLGNVFYDLGANIGLFSLLAARCVGNSGKVFSFEPDAANAARLRRNVARNSFSQVTVIESGVWSSTGTLDFTSASRQSPDRGVGTFIPSGSAAAVTPVSVVSLDDFVRSAPPPDAIKCDVEGAEIEVLRGGQRLLASHRPWILGEMHSAANHQAWRAFLSRFGYTFFALDATHILALPR